MKKLTLNFSIYLSILSIVIFAFSFFAQKTVALSCQKQYGYILDGNKCYNPTTKLSYDNYNHFYYYGINCGQNCDYDGKNCREGVCNAASCAKGYTQFKLEKPKYSSDYYVTCHNPITGLSYAKSKYKIGKTFGKTFFLAGDECGYNCEPDGKDCKAGFCNVDECAKGYTQLKNFKCYNPVTDISYGITYKDDSNHANTIREVYKFYLADSQCGENCNLDGTNCEDGGVCNLSYCNKQAGYTKISFGRCYNEKTHFSYDTKQNFYKYAHYCGTKCDINTGKHCQTGACDASDCAKDYTQIEKGRCYNPKTLLSYSTNHFYHKDIICGDKCDLNGRNCQKGACNVSDCATGYTEFEYARCYNLTTRLSYKPYTEKFYFNGDECGYKCDYDGLHCKEGDCNYKKLKRKKAYYGGPDIGVAWLVGNTVVAVFVVLPYVGAKYAIETIIENNKKTVPKITRAQKNTPDGYKMILLEKNHKK